LGYGNRKRGYGGATPCKRLIFRSAVSGCLNAFARSKVQKKAHESFIRPKEAIAFASFFV